MALQKRAARTHIPHTFQNGFRTQMETCDRTSHVCMRAHTLVINGKAGKSAAWSKFSNTLNLSQSEDKYLAHPN